jgi:hypothetical protein
MELPWEETLSDRLEEQCSMRSRSRWRGDIGTATFPLKDQCSSLVNVSSWSFRSHFWASPSAIRPLLSCHSKSDTLSRCPSNRISATDERIAQCRIQVEKAWFKYSRQKREWKKRLTGSGDRLKDMPLDARNWCIENLEPDPAPILLNPDGDASLLEFICNLAKATALACRTNDTIRGRILWTQQILPPQSRIAASLQDTFA